MLPKKEILKWLKTLPNDAGVFVDEGGLTLKTKDGAYLEVGGEPEEEEEPAKQN